MPYGTYCGKRICLLGCYVVACLCELRGVSLMLSLTGSAVVQQPIHPDQINHAVASLRLRSCNQPSNAAAVALICAGLISTGDSGGFSSSQHSLHMSSA